MSAALMAKRKNRNTKGAAIAQEILEQYQPQTKEEMQDAIKDILGPMFEAMLQGEMDSYLGYDANDHGYKETTNRRNGYIHKNVNTAYGEIPVDVPRDRNATFEPQLIPKRTKDYQMEAILNAPGTEKQSERQNKMLLILGYDAAMRIGEMTKLKVGSLFLDAEKPYIRILGKGEKYRSVPLMGKTVQHLRRYIREFHGDIPDMKAPLFYSVTHGRIHGLSDDCIQKVLKKYTEKCRNEGIDMPSSVHFHMVRKTRAMSLYQESCPLSYIQQMLGHENISTTSGFYAFVTLDTLSKAIEKVNPSGENAEKNWKRKDIAKSLYRL